MAEPIKPVTLTVTPVPARKSRTMRLATVMAALGGIITLIPELIADPAVSAWINESMSPETRRILGVVVVAIGFYLRNLRKTTSAPIAGTPAAVPPVPPESNA